MLEISEHNGEGYLTKISFDTWRVALMNYADKHGADGITYLERHNETDEVFVLLSGKCTLFTADGEIPDEIAVTKLEKGKLYNVKKGTWHINTVSRDAKVLIVENKDTSCENTSYFNLNENLRKIIKENG